MMNTVQSSFPANWSELPDDLLALIIEKFISINSLLDYVRFGAVCSSWLFFLNMENYEHIKLFSRLPVLLIPTPLPIDEGDSNDNYNEQLRIRDYYNSKHVRLICMLDYYNPKHVRERKDLNKHKSTRSFYSLSEKKIYNFQLPVPYYKNCRGSSHGWLITVEYNKDETYSVKLLNPFRSFNNEIQLPPLTTCEDAKNIRDSFFMIKAVLSANPWPSSSSKPVKDVAVMGIYGSRRLGYCRPGDKGWTSLPSKWGLFDDVIYYKGKFYATNQGGLVVAFDVADYLQEPKVTEIAQREELIKEQVYLVECFGDLLQVCRTYNREEIYKGFEVRKTRIGFEVYKLDHSDPRSCSNHKWVQVRDLNGCSLFLGDNASMSVNAADFPGCKPDCIYFTDDRMESLCVYPWLGAQDIGVFCLLDQRFELYHPAKNIIMPAPIWIQPTL